MTESLEEGSVIEGRYRILEQLDAGGVGLVYLAEHMKLSQRVAIKTLRGKYVAHEQMRPRFEREARALASLAHPNIVRITDFSIWEGTPYLVMEYLKGRTVRNLLLDGPLPEERALDILRQLLEALIYAHAEGFVHRDLKPANLFLADLPTSEGHLKVLDFGFVKLLGEQGAGEPDLTQSGFAFGTPSYMSPEQASGGQTGPGSDVYSAGVLLYEMLAGEPPYRGELPEIIRAHLTAPVPSLTAQRPAVCELAPLRRVLVTAMAKEAHDRYPDARAFLDAINALELPLTGEGSSGQLASTQLAVPSSPRGWPTESSAPVLPPTTRPSRLPGLLTAAVLLAVGVAAGVALSANEGPGLADAAASEPLANELAAPDSIVAPPAPGLVELEAAEPDAAAEAIAYPIADGDAGLESDDADPMAFSLDEFDAGGLVSSDGGVERAPIIIDAENPWQIRRRRSLLTRTRRSLLAGRALSEGIERRLRVYARDHRDDPRPHLLLGQGYTARGWGSAALERYELALRIDADSYGDPRMLHDLVLLGSDSRVERQAADLLVRLYGASAMPAVDRALGRSRLPRPAERKLRALRVRLEDVAARPP